MIRTRHITILMMVAMLAFGAIIVMGKACQGMDEMMRQDEATALARRNANPDAVACRQRGGIPVWGNGWNAGTETVVDCRPLPAPSWGGK